MAGAEALDSELHQCLKELRQRIDTFRYLSTDANLCSSLSTIETSFSLDPQQVVSKTDLDRLFQLTPLACIQTLTTILSQIAGLPVRVYKANSSGLTRCCMYVEFL